MERKWQVLFAPEFLSEYRELAPVVQERLAAAALVLSQYGPQLPRPHADTLAGSKFANMKELRFMADSGVWRVAFAFDPVRRGILLVAGDKSGLSQKTFYRRLIATADKRYARHIKRMEGSE